MDAETTGTTPHPHPAGVSPEADLPVLAAPRDGLVELVDTQAGLDSAVGALAAGTGPLAVDTERAQGFRYGSQAYLLQFRRNGAGTVLVDPLAFTDSAGVAQFPPLQQALREVEWIIHAASQDLPCLRMAGLYPTTLFDTELAGRLLGLERVGLSAMVERFFGQRLLKEHSAANWSVRPIPEDWLVYASLDVELLVELREVLSEELTAAGKDEWARQEFEHVLASFAEPAPPRRDPWRRTNGMNLVKTTAGLAVVRELWGERDQIAQRLDLAPGKVLPDKAITELAATISTQAQLPGRDQLRRVEGFRRRQAHRHESSWIAAIDRVATLTRDQLPPKRPPHDPSAISSPKSWERHEPEAFARWNVVRPGVNELAEQWQLPPENLVSPDVLKRLTYRPPAQPSSESVGAALAALGARPWQQELLAEPLATMLADPTG